jgi:hypothetical protein
MRTLCVFALVCTAWSAYAPDVSRHLYVHYGHVESRYHPDDPCAPIYSLPSSSPTTASQATEPTFAPTHLPTRSGCIGGSRGCDANSTRCELVIGGSFTCTCLEGFVSDPASPALPSDSGGQGATRCKLTQAPTANPTFSPTKMGPTGAPTPCPATNYLNQGK